VRGRQKKEGVEMHGHTKNHKGFKHVHTPTTHIYIFCIFSESLLLPTPPTLVTSVIEKIKEGVGGEGEKEVGEEKEKYEGKDRRERGK
jgi:hypothetical protein